LTIEGMNNISANESYHDRVAERYDAVYAGPRWDLWHEFSWQPLKAHLPADLRAPVLDVGCGTGKYGLRAAKSGYTVTLSDLSRGMLEVARRKAAEMGLEERVAFIKQDVADLSALPREHFGLVIAQGDVISFASQPAQAIKAIRKVLRPGGVVVASVDQTLAALNHYAEKQDLDSLEKLAQTGEMEWLAHEREERFPVHTFTVERLRGSFEKAGFEILDIFGKTVLPLKLLEPLLGEARARDRIAALEKKLCRLPSAMGLASHLQIAARKQKA
jgi:ubiquinone/menaquinone biosynthesis C-methylase UbiE